MALKYQNQVLLVKIESSEGVDASPAVTDAVKLDATTIKFNADLQQPTEATGAIDAGEFDIGRTTVDLPVTVKLKGSGAAATVPEVDALLKMAGWYPTTLSAPVPATSTTTATAGDATSFTIDRSIATDWSATTGTYEGMVVTLAGNPAVAVTVQIVSYVVTGNNAVVTVDRTFSPVLSVATTAVIPIQHRYSPYSGVIPSGTIYWYVDGLQYTSVGGRADVTLEMTNSNKADLKFTPQSLVGTKTDVAVPTGTFDATSPPRWRLQDGGKFMIDRVAVGVSRFTIGFNNEKFNPGNPNGTDGIDPTLVVGRDIQGEMDPLMTLVATRNEWAKFRAGTKSLLTAQIGSTVGNRMFVMVKSAKYRDASPTSDSKVLRETIPFSAISSNDGAYLTFA